MFWFRVTACVGILGSQRGGEGRHPRRTWREEEIRWSSGRDPRRLSLCVSGRFCSPRSKSLCFPRTIVVRLVLWVLSSLSFCLIWLNLVKYCSSSDRCHCVFSLLKLSPSSLPFPLSRSTRPRPAGSHGKLFVALPSFSFVPLSLLFSFSRGLCPPVTDL